MLNRALMGKFYFVRSIVTGTLHIWISYVQMSSSNGLQSFNFVSNAGLNFEELRNHLKMNKTAV